MPWHTVFDDWIGPPEPGAVGTDGSVLLVRPIVGRMVGSNNVPFTGASMTSDRSWAVQSPVGTVWDASVSAVSIDLGGASSSVSVHGILIVFDLSVAQITSAVAQGAIINSSNGSAGGFGLKFGASTSNLTGETLALIDGTSNASGITDTIALGPHVLAIQHDGDRYKWFLDGQPANEIHTATPIGLQPLSNFAYYLGRSSSSAPRVRPSLIALSLSKDVDMRQYDAAPWQLFAPVERRIWIPAGGSGPTYTLTADGATYSLTAPAANLKASRKLAAAVGSFSVTGADVGLYVQRRIVAGQASYSYTGTNVNLKVSRKLVAGTGTYSLTGQDATLTYFGGFGPTYTLSAGAGSYSITGTNVSLKVSRKLVAEAGSYTYSGSSVGLSYSGAVSNMPPYITVYFWRRTA